MSEPELRLNQLSRFSKKSPNLVLEEYSHCEVPAGCGGVVLRWRRPNDPVPMTMDLFRANGTWQEMALDGQDTQGVSKVPVPLGRHALTVVMTEVDTPYACLLFAARLDPDYVRVLGLTGDTGFLSLPDGTWRCTLDAPANEAWKQPDYDDSGWQRMVERPFGPLPKQYGGTMEDWTHSLLEKGARGLGVGEESGVRTVYIRREIRVLAPERQA